IIVDGLPLVCTGVLHLLSGAGKVGSLSTNQDDLMCVICFLAQPLEMGAGEEFGMSRGTKPGLAAILAGPAIVSIGGGDVRLAARQESPLHSQTHSVVGRHRPGELSVRHRALKA